MADKTAGTPKEKIAIGLLCGGFGLYIVLVGLTVLPVPGGRDNLHAPFWVAICAGLVFLIAGLNLVVQGIGRADANATLPAGAPAWMTVVQYGSVPAIFACLAMIGTWIAIGPHERGFGGTFAGLESNDLIGLAFGIGAVIAWLCTLAFVVRGLRMLRQRRRTG